MYDVVIGVVDGVVVVVVVVGGVVVVVCGCRRVVVVVVVVVGTVVVTHVVTGAGAVVVGGGGGGGSLVTVTVCTCGLGGGGGALVGCLGAAVLGGLVVASVLLVALVNAIATPPTAISATAAATPNTNCGNRCHVRGWSIGPVGGTYCACGRIEVMSVA